MLLTPVPHTPASAKKMQTDPKTHIHLDDGWWRQHMKMEANCTDDSTGNDGDDGENLMHEKKQQRHIRLHNAKVILLSPGVHAFLSAYLSVSLSLSRCLFSFYQGNSQPQRTCMQFIKEFHSTYSIPVASLSTLAHKMQPIFHNFHIAMMTNTSLMLMDALAHRTIYISACFAFGTVWNVSAWLFTSSFIPFATSPPSLTRPNTHTHTRARRKNV